MLILDLLGGPGHLDPLILLLLALALDAGLGEGGFLLRRLPHPVVAIGCWIDFLEGRLNRDSRSQADRAIRGALMVLAIVGACAVIGLAVAWLTLHHAFGWILETVLLVQLLAQRELYDRVRDVGVALAGQGLEPARAAVGHIVGRDPAQLDEHGVARAAIESLAENFSDGVVAPVFWYLIAGFPGLLVYKAVNTMDSMVGHRTPRFQAFGMTAARLDDVLNLIPARLSGLFVALAAAFVPTSRPWVAFRTLWRDAGKHRSPNSGWPEAAMAGALGLALAGPRRYREEVVQGQWIGEGTARATAEDVRRALSVYVVACLIDAVWVAAFAVLRLA